MFRFGLRVIARARTVSDLISSLDATGSLRDLLLFIRGFSMFQRTAAALVVSAALTTSAAFAHPRPPNPRNKPSPAQTACAHLQDQRRRAHDARDQLPSAPG
jgi:hypothetical protein